MKTEYLEKPCRNFCFRSSLLMTDPLDGRQKMILSSFVAGGLGELIFVDPKTKKGETFVLPGDSGAYALLVVDNRKLLVGSCGRYGYLHCLDLIKREWEPSLRVDPITYIWDFAQAADGYVYGGTYPECALLRYDPKKHELINLGPITDVEENLYSRDLCTPVSGKVYINCGLAEPMIGIYDCETQKMSQTLPGCQIIHADEQAMLVKTPDGEKLLDPSTFLEIKNDDWLAKRKKKDDRLPVPAGFMDTFSDGTVFGMSGQRCFTISKNEQQPTFFEMPADPPPTEIFAMTADDQGHLYGATGLGGTMFSYNTKTGEYWNSDILTQRAGGEAYGVVAHNGLVYFTNYSGGDHIVYDPTQPWNRIENKNPITLQPIGPDYVRPQARSFLGPDQGVWTGWIAEYGKYGCAVSKIDTKTHEVTNYTDLVPKQGIASITGDDTHIFFTTNGSCNGLKTKKEPFHLIKMHKDGTIEKDITFLLGDHLPTVYASHGRLFLYLIRDGKVLVWTYDIDTMEKTEESTSNMLPTRIVPAREGELLAMGSKREADSSSPVIAILDAKTMEVIRATPVSVSTASICYSRFDDSIYYAQHAKLYRMSYD